MPGREPSGAGGVVEGDRGGGFAPRLDGPDLERRFRQVAEPLRRGVHHLGDEGAGVGQILFLALGRVRILELRVGLEQGEERLQRAGEADLVHDRLHLALESGDLAQADVVNLVGGQVGGGRELEAGIVIGLAVRQPPDTGAVVGHGGGPGPDLGQSGQHTGVATLPRTGQGGPSLAHQPGPGGPVSIEGLDLLAEIGPDRIVRPVVKRGPGDDGAGVVDRGREHEVRRDHPFGRAGPQCGRNLAHDPFGLDQARDIGVGVGDAVDAVVVDHEHRQSGRRIAVGGELEAPVAPLVRQARLLDPVFEQTPRQPAALAQRLRIEFVVQARQLALGQGQLAIGGRVRGVVEPVVIRLDAERGHRLRAERDPFHEGLFEKGVQTGVLARGRSDDRVDGGGHGHGDAGAGGQKQDGNRRNQDAAHGTPGKSSGDHPCSPAAAQPLARA